jgi:hypothetical protein
MADLVLLSADVDIEASLEAILQRHQSLGIRPVEVELLRHPGHDAGVFTGARDVLRPYARSSSYALAVLDCAWDGNPYATPLEVEEHVKAALAPDWGDRSAVIAIEPEVETWVWSTSPHVAASLGWPEDTASLRAWLEQRGLWAPKAPKPSDPKEAFETACRQARSPATSAMFRQILSKVSLANCVDRAFLRLKMQLAEWFPLHPPEPSTPGQ